MRMRDAEDTPVEATRLVVTRIPEDVYKALINAYKHEENEIAKIQLENMIKSVEISRRYMIPICQDTRIITFLVRVGVNNPLLRSIREAIVRATKRTTEVIPLRQNSVDSFTNKNSGDNTGRHIPFPPAPTLVYFSCFQSLREQIERSCGAGGWPQDPALWGLRAP